MKKILMVFVMIISMTSCVTTRSTSKINQIELGMSKSDIRHLFGNPIYRSAWQEGEQWGYHKEVGDILGPEPVLLLISFNKNEKVTEFETVKEFPRVSNAYIFENK